MTIVVGILLGLLTGIIATLVADNPQVRFYFEKFIRKCLGQPLVTVQLTGFPNYCHDGMLMVFCLEIKNKMWFTSQIPRVYLLASGMFEYDSRAYKPLLYFRSHGLYGFRIEQSLDDVLNEYQSSIIPYSQDQPNLGLTLSRKSWYRVAVLCEMIKYTDDENSRFMNTGHMLGELRIPIANPMPSTKPGAWWDINLISEDFGLIDIFHVKIPDNLEEEQSLGDRHTVFQMKERAACFLDLGLENMLTWPLRLVIDDASISVKQENGWIYVVTKPKKMIHHIRLNIRRRNRLKIFNGIKIQ